MGMTNSPKDLDMSDVIADAQTMMSAEFEEWGDQLDPTDLFTIIQTLETNDLLQGYDNPLDSPLVQEMIANSQSNPQKAEYALRQMIDLDNAMGDL